MDEAQIDAPLNNNNNNNSAKKEEDTVDESSAALRNDDDKDSHGEGEEEEQEEEEEEKEDKKPAPSVGTKIKATSEMRQAILEALSTGRMKQAPHGIIKGRIRYYQRQGSRWRMEVDDVRIRRRVPLAKIRRKRQVERPSLWDLSRESRQGKVGPAQAGRINDDDTQTKWSFELLAYNDVE